MSRPKPPTQAKPKAPVPRSAPFIPNISLSADSKNSRWQRTVRYAWDKGGSKGGR